jgi:hypothetical protein
VKEKPRSKEGGGNTFQKQWHCSVTFHEKNTAATAVTVCLGTTASRIATGVA